jgi:phage terminase large subunit-like protein
LVPKKEHRDSPKKIDGIDALIMAIGGSITGNERSVYEAEDRSEGIRYV